jgi:hypothetical protein
MECNADDKERNMLSTNTSITFPARVKGTPRVCRVTECLTFLDRDRFPV